MQHDHTLATADLFTSFSASLSLSPFYCLGMGSGVKNGSQNRFPFVPIVHPAVGREQEVGKLGRLTTSPH